MTQNAPPAPVQALSYATVIDSPWPGVVRLVAFVALALGCTRLIQLTRMGWLLFASAGPFVTYASIGLSLSSTIAGILCIIGSIGLLRRRKSANLVIAACWVLIGVSALGLVSSSVQFLTNGALRRSSGQPVIFWGLQLVSSTTWAFESAMLPLMILMLLRMAMRDPQYRATLTQ